MGAEAYEDYRQAIHDPDTVHAMCMAEEAPEALVTALRAFWRTT